MIPNSILQYLDGHGVTYKRHPHPRAITAQELAASIHVSGYRVAKAVIVDAGGRLYLAVLPAPDLLDEERFARAVGADEVVLCDEDQFGSLFPDCEVGAEPPFGGLYGLPVVLDESLADIGPLIVRAGSHEETLEIDSDDFVRLENPRIAEIGRPFPTAPRAQVQPEAHP